MDSTPREIPFKVFRDGLNFFTHWYEIYSSDVKL